MSKATKLIAAASLLLLALSYATCQFGERRVHEEMAKYPPEFVAAHEFDLVFFKFVLPGIAMGSLGVGLALVAIVWFIADRKRGRVRR